MKIRSLYKTGAWLFGVAAAGYSATRLVPEIKKELQYEDKLKSYSERLSYHDYHSKYFLKYQNNATTCAEKIRDQIICTTPYPFHLGSADDTVVKTSTYAALGLFGMLGCGAVGLSVGLTWPVTVPLLGLYKLETDYGYKLC